MSQQTQIDSFFRSISCKKFRPAPSETKTRKDECDSETDCIVIYEKVNGNTPLTKSQELNISVDSNRKLATFNNNSNLRLKKSPKRDSRGTDFLNNHSSTSSPSKESNSSPKEQSKRKRRYSENFSYSEMPEALVNMNLRKQGVISQNNFNLEDLYLMSKSAITLEHKLESTMSSVYDKENIILYEDTYSQMLMNIIFTVLSNPLNCGYFQEGELDLIYAIITLPSKVQDLFVRMIKRKRGWHRRSSIKYPSISIDLRNLFEELNSRNLCTFDLKSEELSALFDLLLVDEVRAICKDLKINSNRKKTDIINDLIKFGSNTKPLFPGMKNGNSVLYSKIFKILNCVRITDETWNIIDKVITLFIPKRDPKESISDMFFMLLPVYNDTVKYPKVERKQFPLFCSTEHLIRYIEANYTLFKVYQFIDYKKWDKVRECGDTAMDKLSVLLKIESERLKDSNLPACMRSFMPGCTWLKVLSKTITAFKKLADKSEVTQILNFLITQDCHLQSKKGEWLSELALIEMHHAKNIEASALVVIAGLNIPNLTQVDRVELSERADKLVKRKRGGVSSVTKTKINEILQDSRCLPQHKFIINTVNASRVRGNTTSNKTVWCIESNTTEQIYGSVESVALDYYTRKNKFLKGLHCEGRLPISLFFIVFWEELFNIYLPHAFVTKYQTAPLDLYYEDFYENRKDMLDAKLETVARFSDEALSSWMEQRYQEFSKYKSAMSLNLFQCNTDVKEIAYCLGVRGVLGICRRMMGNYKLWSAGFPDLIVWNIQTKECQIVEVKGPNDTLSTKQRLWLEYLYQLHLNTEVCSVQDRCKPIKRKSESD